MSNVAAKNNRTALIAALAGLAMLGAAFASVPLYRLFCQATGYDGTVQRAETAPGADAAAGTVNVRFDGNVVPSLPWKFGPVQKSVRVVPGAPTRIFYQATNLSNRTITGQAGFNVSPSQVGAFFDKIQCFCFTEQTLKPGETVKMPVLFYVDPKFRQDPDVKDLDEITLSYTFYPVESPATGG